MEHYLCIEGYPGNLTNGKIYQGYPHSTDTTEEFLKILNDKGDEFMYYAKRFEKIEVSSLIDLYYSSRK